MLDLERQSLRRGHRGRGTEIYVKCLSERTMKAWGLGSPALHPTPSPPSPTLYPLPHPPALPTVKTLAGALKEVGSHLLELCPCWVKSFLSDDSSCLSGRLCEDSMSR